MGKAAMKMLFVLGTFLRETNRRFKTAPLRVTISKAYFIDAILIMSLVGKKERSIYKNLELLEKDKFVVYKDKNLRLSKKGFNIYFKMYREYEERKQMVDAVVKSKLVVKERILQTKLRG
jgi:hypothetical protein